MEPTLLKETTGLLRTPGVICGEMDLWREPEDLLSSRGIHEDLK